MFLSFYLVCIFCVFTWYTDGSQAQGQNTDLSSSQLKNSDLKMISQQNTKISKLEKFISRLETKIEQQNTKFSDQNTLIEQQNTKFADQNTKFADQNTKFADQNTEIANQKILISDQNALIEHQNTKISEQNTKLYELKTQLELSLKSDSTATATQSPIITGNDTGVIFTRWGRTDCPETISTKVYNGSTGGDHYLHPGGAVNYVCLPGDPIFNQNKYYSTGSFGYMYGAEYENVPHSNNIIDNIQNYKVPCVVCRATPYSTKIMIPGRNKCYPGWQEAYHGHLNSGQSNLAAASEYACLDRHPTATGSNSNSNQKFFYPVKAQRGALPDYYPHGALLTCVVCLK